MLFSPALSATLVYGVLKGIARPTGAWPARQNRQLVGSRRRANMVCTGTGVRWDGVPRTGTWDGYTRGGAWTGTPGAWYRAILP